MYVKNSLSDPLFQSTPPVKAATHLVPKRHGTAKISIHAAREGGDVLRGVSMVDIGIISIHAAREGGDLLLLPKKSFSY